MALAQHVIIQYNGLFSTLPTLEIGQFGYTTDSFQVFIGTSAGNKELGVAGTSGSQFISGAVAPTTEGDVGDLYLDTVAVELYGPKTAEGWGTGVSLKGAAGDPGTVLVGTAQYQVPVSGADPYDVTMTLISALVDGTSIVATDGVLAVGDVNCGSWDA